jgi:hypothetical protein
LVLAPAAANGEPAAQASPHQERATEAKKKVASLTLDQRLARVKRVVQRWRNIVRYHARNRALLASSRPVRLGMKARYAERRLARALGAQTVLQRAVDRRDARRLAKASPRVAICHVFGKRYCAQALRVSWCESRHSTRAQNGQYLGLFQMGSWERQRFGHGATPHSQAVAAHKYFALTGRDWSPWSCKPWYAM